jgi:hypothetical protein
MPPWFIDKNVGMQHFNNDTSMTDEEIATIVKWVDGGAPEGNPADMPPARRRQRLFRRRIGRVERKRKSKQGPRPRWNCSTL